uniref:Uncharacterized protein n=1 Tax=Timema genevievae TaxID=629358 RepID=A0A7R9JXV4_TIMGE|nr:unnamed protein product [Timema genevievae]
MVCLVYINLQLGLWKDKSLLETCKRVFTTMIRYIDIIFNACVFTKTGVIFNQPAKMKRVEQVNDYVGMICNVPLIPIWNHFNTIVPVEQTNITSQGLQIRNQQRLVQTIFEH